MTLGVPISGITSFTLRQEDGMGYNPRDFTLEGLIDGTADDWREWLQEAPPGPGECRYGWLCAPQQ